MWALPQAVVICRFCGEKIKEKNIKQPNPARLPLDSNQLVLFAEFFDS
jgi:hypothetical protein